MEFSSGISEGVVVRRPVLVEMDSVRISLKLLSKYIWEVPSGTLSGSNSHSVTGGDLLNSEGVEWSNSSFERV